MDCDCNICKDMKRVQSAIDKRDTDTLIAVLREFTNRWLNADSDNDYYHCVLDGSWPTSVRILKDALTRIEAHKREEIEKHAYHLYCKRIKFNLVGDSTSDWLIAEYHVERGQEDGDV